ncbi:MAG: pilus assembly protein [Thermoleophilia bacterium]|nr:pilus assembly protein [Thermoleophilia bacterium]
MKRSSSSETGQSMVEFAMILPVLFLVLFGIFQFGLVFGKQLDLKSATRDGARRAAVSMDRPDPVRLTRQAIFDTLSLTKDDEITIDVSPPPPWNHGDRITVRTSTPHEFSVMGVVAWSGNLRAESEIRVE